MIEMTEQQNQRTPGQRTVEEVYSIDEDELHVRAELGHPYWVRSSEFYQNVRRRQINYLSDHQLTWLQRIEDALSGEEASN